MKNIIYIILMTLTPMLAFSQVYVKAPNGHTGIGIDTPTQKLDVNGNANVRGNFLNIGQDAGTAAAYLRIVIPVQGVVLCFIEVQVHS